MGSHSSPSGPAEPQPKKNFCSFFNAENRFWCMKFLLKFKCCEMLCHWAFLSKRIPDKISDLHVSGFKWNCQTDLVPTRSSAIAEGPRDASCQLKSCQLTRNNAETTCTTTTTTTCTSTLVQVLNKSKLWSWRVTVDHHSIEWMRLPIRPIETMRLSCTVFEI